MLTNYWRRWLLGHVRSRRIGRRFSAQCESLEVRNLLAADVFVATTGSDQAGTGSVSSPFATLAKAVAVAQSGDSIILRDGTYLGGVRVTLPEITIKSFENETAVVKLPSNNDSRDEIVIWFQETASGGRLQGLEIIGGSFYGVKVDSDISGKPEDWVAATGVIIEDCRIHDTGRDCIKITPGCDDVIIRRNEIYNSGKRDNSNAEGIDNVNGDRMIVQENYIHDIATNGLYAKGGSIGTLIEGNLVTNTGEAGILLGFSDTDSNVFDTTVNQDFYENIDGVVKNNVVINTQGAGIGLFAARNPVVANNTLVNVAQSIQSALFMTTSVTYFDDDKVLRVANRDVMIGNNIVQQSAATTQPMFQIREDSVTGTLTIAANRYFHVGGDALFEDRRARNEFDGDFAGWQAHLASEVGSSEGDPGLDANRHLLPGSPCIDAGNGQFKFASDYDGDGRTAAIDIGADEFFAATALTIPPLDGTIGTGRNTSNNPPEPPKVSFSSTSSSASEATATGRLSVRLSAAATQTVTVGYTITGTATSGADFGQLSGTLTFSPGQR